MIKSLVVTGGRAADGPYGIDKLNEFGFELCDVPDATARAHVKLRDVFEHRLGLPIDKALRSTWLAASADLVIAFLENFARTPAWLKRHNVRPWRQKPLVMFECWLAEVLRQLPRDDRRRMTRDYQGVDLTFAWSSNQLDILVDAGFRESAVAAVPFGFAPEQFPFVPAAERSGGIVAIGQDRGRDYGTLIEAVSGTDLHVQLVAGPGALGGAPPPPQIDFRGRVSYSEYRRLLATAQVVVVPTKELAYPTGQTVAMDAAGAGATVVVTDTTPMREYFTGQEALLVPPGDATSLREALTVAREDAGLRERLGLQASRRMNESFTYRQMWARVVEALASRGLVAAEDVVVRGV